MEQKNQNLGQIIREKRIEQKFSQEELAEQLNVSRQAVAKWESGKSFPSTERLMELCRVLDISTEELFGQREEKKSEGRIDVLRLAIAAFVSGCLIAGVVILFYDTVGLNAEGWYPEGITMLWTILNCWLLLWGIVAMIAIVYRVLKPK